MRVRVKCRPRIKAVFFALVVFVSARSHMKRVLTSYLQPCVAWETDAERNHSAKIAQTIPVLGVLVLNGDDLLLRLLRSIDYPVQKVVIFHNYDTDENINHRVHATLEQIQLGNTSSGPDRAYVHEIIQLYRPHNLGFSAGVNKIVLATPLAKFWIIASNDVAFYPGRLEEVAQVMHDSESKRSQSCLWGLVGHEDSPYSTFVLTRRALHTVGFFDVNFWPAYAEDCDYTARLVRAHCSIVFENDTKRVAAHEESASLKRASQSNSTLSQLVTQQSGSGFNNFDYVLAKWGVNVCDLRLNVPPYMALGGFNTPFNSTEFNQSMWTLDMQRRVSRGGPRECIVCDSRSSIPF